MLLHKGLTYIYVDKKKPGLKKKASKKSLNFGESFTLMHQY